MSKRPSEPSSVIPVWAQKKQVRAGPSAEDPASEDACVVEKPALSFEEVKAANADRLKVIGSLSLKTEAAVEEIMAEVKAMRPKPGPGFVHEGELLVMTRRGNLYRGTPWAKSKKAQAWTLTIDFSASSKTKHLVVYKGSWHEVCQHRKSSVVCLV